MRRVPFAAAFFILSSLATAVGGTLGGCGLALDGYAGPPLADAAPIEDGRGRPDDAANAQADAPPDAALLDASDAETDASGPITFVQTNASSTDVGNTTSFTVAFDAPVANHDTLVAAILLSPHGATITGVTDTLGNAFQILCNEQFDAFDENVYLVASFDIAGGAADALTLHGTGSSETSLIVHEYANVAASGSCLPAVGSATAVDGIVSPPLTTTVPNELLFAYAVGSAVGPGTGFTARSTFESDVTEDRIAPDPGMHVALASVTNNVPNWAIVAAAFLPR